VTTRLVVLSDTHMPRHGRRLPRVLLDAFSTAQTIVHLGDFTEISVVHELQRHAPLVGVAGNNDSAEIRAMFPYKRTLEVEGKRFVLIHGHREGRTALQAARSVDTGDAVLFGHSHSAYNVRENGRLLFNPGSPTERRWSAGLSFGIIDVGEIVESQLISVR
jgi:putative phosphoesterase